MRMSPAEGLKPGDHIEQCCLAAAARPDQCDELTGWIEKEAFSTATTSPVGVAKRSDRTEDDLLRTPRMIYATIAQGERHSSMAVQMLLVFTNWLTASNPISRPRPL